jgi:hypothetical protein
VEGLDYSPRPTALASVNPELSFLVMSSNNTLSSFDNSFLASAGLMIDVV